MARSERELGNQVEAVMKEMRRELGDALLRGADSTVTFWVTLRQGRFGGIKFRHDYGRSLADEDEDDHG